MKMTKRFLFAGLFALLALHNVQALEAGRTTGGIDYASGGVGDSERASLLEQKSHFSFWLNTATKGSGAYLSGVRVRILDLRNKQPVLEYTMDGPWLFAALPPGRYQIEASYQDGASAPEQMVKKVTTVGAGKTPRQMMLYFSSADAAPSTD
jgi:hypothetical protein